MKKISILLFLSCFFICGCILNPDYLKKDYTFENKSSFTVSFTLNEVDNNVYTLLPGESFTQYTYGYQNPHFIDNPRVRYISSNTDCIIVNMDYVEIVAYNNSPYSVSLSEKNNYINNYGDIVLLGASQIATIKLYTERPDFIITYTSGAASGFPADFTYDKDAEKITIKNTN